MLHRSTLSTSPKGEWSKWRSGAKPLFMRVLHWSRQRGAKSGARWSKVERSVLQISPFAKVLSRISEGKVNLVDEILIPGTPLSQDIEHIRPNLVRHGERRLTTNPIEGLKTSKTVKCIKNGMLCIATGYQARAT
jgi:hypothetical protein